jgi:hypothetical protein
MLECIDIDVAFLLYSSVCGTEEKGHSTSKSEDDGTVVYDEIAIQGSRHKSLLY